MALGTFGSTLNDELNRLANGGTYRTEATMVDEALAAKQWANREYINPYSTDTVGILNEIAGLGLDKRNWLDFNGVCNYLAGTTGLPAAAALRQIYPTTDLLTSQSAYYVDATAPTNWGALGYVRLNGVTGNYLTVPDANNLDITGDIDLRAYVSADNWTSGSIQRIITKWQTANQFSYGMYIANGNIVLQWSTDGGTGATLVAATSTATVTISNGQPLWIRATLSVASNFSVIFYTSTDGTTWTKLGNTVTGVGATSIFASTSQIEIGSGNSGSNLLTGNVYRAQILNGIGGTTVLDVNIASNYLSSNQSFFTATTGQTVTVNGVDVINNLGTGADLLPTTLGSSTAADSNDPRFLDFTGTNYVYLPGVAGNNLTVPDAASLRITGDIDLRVRVSMDNWVPSAFTTLIGRSIDSTVVSYRIQVSTGGLIQLVWSPDGTTANQVAVSSTVATGLANGVTKWIRATLSVASNYTVRFFTSDDGTNWTQLGTTVTGVGATSIFAGTAVLEIGTRNNSSSGALAGNVYRAQIYNGIDGTKVLDVDTSTLQTGADAYIVPTTYSGAAGAFFTGTGLSLNGVAGNYVSTPDANQLDITGDIDIAVQVAMDDWTPSAEMNLIGKWQTAGQVSWLLRLMTDGKLLLFWSSTGSFVGGNTFTSSVATGVTDGTAKWVRVTLDVNNGASGKDCKFWLSDDGTTWTQLGTTQTTAGAISLFAGTSQLEIGAAVNGTDFPAKGTFYRAVIKNGIDGFPVFDATFVGVPANSLRMTESSVYKAVVTLNTTRYCTINRSTSGRKTVAVTQPVWLFGTDDYMEVNNRYMSSGTYLYLPGVASNYASAPDSAALDITSDIDIRCKVALDDWTPAANNILISKWTTATNNRSYQLLVATSGALTLQWSSDGATLTGSVLSTAVPTITDGSTKWVRATLDVDNGASGKDVKFFTSDDGTTWTQLGTTVTSAGTTSIFSGSQQLEIGSRNTGANEPARGKFFRAQVLSGIDGTVAFDANFETSITSLNQATFTESSTNAATVTINRSGSAYRSAGITAAGYLYPGATNTFKASATDLLNFGAADSFTALVVGRQWATPANNGMYLSKQDSASPFIGWNIGASGTSLRHLFSPYDGTNSVNILGVAFTSGSLNILGGILNRTAGFDYSVTNSTITTGSSITSVGSLSNINTMRIGTRASLYQDFEAYAVAVFRSALTAAQIRQISNYFANREVYL